MGNSGTATLGGSSGGRTGGSALGSSGKGAGGKSFSGFGGSKETGGYGGGVNAKFSGRVLGEKVDTPKLSVGPESSLVGIKSVNAAAKFTRLSTGITPPARGLSIPGIEIQGRRQTTVAETPRPRVPSPGKAGENIWNPRTFQEFNPAVHNSPNKTAYPEMSFSRHAKRESDGKNSLDFIKRSGRYRLPPETHAPNLFSRPEVSPFTQKSVSSRNVSVVEPTTEKYAPHFENKAANTQVNTLNRSKEIVDELKIHPSLRKDAIRKALGEIDVENNRKAQPEPGKPVIERIAGLDTVAQGVNVSGSNAVSEKPKAISTETRSKKGTNIISLLKEKAIKKAGLNDAENDSKKPGIGERVKVQLQKVRELVAQRAKRTDTASAPVSVSKIKPELLKITRSLEIGNDQLLRDRSGLATVTQLRADATRLALPSVVNIDKTEAQVVAQQYAVPEPSRVSTSDVIDFAARRQQRGEIASQTQTLQDAQVIQFPSGLKAEQVQAVEQLLAQEQAIEQALESPHVAPQSLPQQTTVENDTLQENLEEDDDSEPEPEPEPQPQPMSVDEDAVAARVNKGLIGVELSSNPEDPETAVDGYKVAENLDFTGEDVKSRIVKGNKSGKGDGSLGPTAQSIRQLSYIPRGDASELLKKIVMLTPPVDNMPGGKAVRKSDVDLVVNGEQIIYKAA